MKHYMQTMASVLDGSHSGVVDLKYFDAKYVSVYRNNSATAHIDVLRANYKSVAALVGDEFFAGLCLEYIKKYPARQRSLVGYGEHFTQFLDDNLQHHNLPYLSSFAKLDRAWTLAHTARDAEPLAMAVLEDIIQQGGDLEKFELFIKPDVFLVGNGWPVFAIWANLREGEAIKDAVDMNEQPENALVWRYGQEVMYRDLEVGEVAFLSTVKKGGNLGLATVKALEAEPATNVGQLLGGMVTAELFTIEKPTKGDAHA
jgi:Putative DNA-binding domain